MTHLNVTTALGTREEALALLRSAVKSRHAASGQIHGPVTAAWWHNGEYGESEEWVLLLKTTTANRAALETHLAESHPWGTTAEVTVTPIDGTPYYLDWITRTTTG
ncbi:divalent-cation tolerance protein CutA [Actinocorallia sp. A-T 12471]|uniref:divalent-cation tolerance protein CutA n=1 Tax=Actinocorallia sp. A-T 12471 TaxID=3089813 RepID=UPI0029CD3576|nr:divalent cation tolerance protein CutA [Actinocorallia sp. A-T 12471]MDX6739308.1 divalent cation tolerance protein CutA [Actinocorallia sp. A-T 12471]